MARWCYSMVLLLLIGSSTSVPVDPYDDANKYEFEHDNINPNHDEDPSPMTAPFAVTRTTFAYSLQCFNCSSMDDATCLAPSKTRTNVTTCSSEGSKCFTMTTKRTNNVVVVKRGCQEKCVVDHWTTCCEEDLCNSQLVREIVQPMTAVVVSRRFNQPKNKSDKPLPQTVLFFVTVLLLLQTVVKVALV